MKNNKILYIAIIVVIVSMGAVLQTDRIGWNASRAAIDTDDTLVTDDPNGMKFADVPSDAYQPNDRHNGIEIAWVMDANDSSCVATVFAAKSKGDIAQVWTGTITAGAQESTSDEYYVDTFATTTDTWITTISEVDCDGNDRMARIVFDTCGYRYFFVQYTGLSSETVRAYMSGY